MSEYHDVMAARDRSEVLGHAAVALLREHPDPRTWEAGPAACLFLRLGGDPDEWSGFRALLVAEAGCRQVADDAHVVSAVARMAAPFPADPDAYARSLHEWFAARGEWSYGEGCAYAERRPSTVPVCEDPEGFLRYGWDCRTCTYRDALVLPDEPAVRLEEVAL